MLFRPRVTTTTTADPKRLRERSEQSKTLREQLQEN
jgi:hypothetical protein